MPGIIKEVVLKFPADFVRKCPGFSLDIGGSAVKFIYRSKEAWQELENNKDATTGKLTFLTCGRPDIDRAIDKVKANAHITRQDGKRPKAYSCGVGGYQYNQQLQDALDIEIENVVEGDCIIEGIQHFLRRIPEVDLLHEPMHKDIEEALDMMKEMIEMWTKMEEKSKHKLVNAGVIEENTDNNNRGLNKEKSIVEVIGEEELFPALYLQLGSAYGYLKVNKEGPLAALSMTNAGGRTFMGIASLLTGTKSYDEFIDLAEKGNQWAVDQSIKSVLNESKKDGTNDDDPYAVLSDTKSDIEQICFSFGHTVFKPIDAFKREDLASAWLVTHLSETADRIVNHALAHGIKHVLVAGSLANREFVRKHLTREVIRVGVQTGTWQLQKIPDIELHFLKSGGHIGAFGAMMNSVEKFSIDRAGTCVDEK